MNCAILSCLLWAALSFSVYGQSALEVDLLYHKIKTDLKSQKYLYALAKAKYYRIKYLGKDHNLYNSKILLAEAFVLNKYCYENQVNQLLRTIEYYNKKYNLGTEEIEGHRKNLKLARLGKTPAQSEPKSFLKDEVVWEIPTNSINDIENFDLLFVQLESKC